jgi:hypothetical protein
MSESHPARSRITYLVIADGREKSADLTGCPEWSVEECCRGKLARGPGGPMTLDALIRVREWVYLLRGRRYGSEPGVVYLRLWPERSASLFAMMGLLPPPDLEDWNGSAPVLPPGAPPPLAERDQGPALPPERDQGPAPPPASAKREGTPEGKPKRNSAQERRESIKMSIDSLLDAGLWGITVREIARRAHLPEKTVYRHLRHKTVKPTWDRYRRESQGKPPANLDDLGK